MIPNTLPLSEAPYTTPAEFVSAALWDIASAIDPIFMTDALNWIFGLGQ